MFNFDKMNTSILTKQEIESIAFKQSLNVFSLTKLTPSEELPIFIDQACELTGYSKSTIYVMIHKKEIPFHKVAGFRKLFFYKSKLLAWMKSKEEVSV